ncbi:PhaM family polyhydroxyalkanoate granule multifunctional regulatory protein [Comamonas sp. A7-5]|uniref:PhaM family polyhydroxyalkanoate granule multifunctional regulatory protein n=1 Tax=Comamonas sp. A7-5 TaxID=673549 RepID=UPI0031D20C52
MSGDASAFGFGKFIPGFDFLQGLAQSAGAAANPMGRVPQWVAPTVSVEEVDKRIAELKAVQFWLEQNSRALAATIQALEVQRMTLSTLKDMNVSMSELAKSFPFPGAAPAEPAATGNTGWPMGTATAAPAAEPAAEPEPEAEPAAAEADSRTQAGPSSQAALSQAMQWWGALTQQFQQIAAKAMAEPVPPETLAAAQRATEMASGFAKSTMEKVMAQAGGFGTAAAAKTAEKNAAKSAATAEPKPARKAAAKTSQPKTAASKTAAAKKTAAKQPAAKKTTAKTSATSRKP